MFDSDNISIATRVESCDGIDVTYNLNSVGEAVWKVCINSAWLQSQIDARFATLNTTALDRIDTLETVTGVSGAAGSSGGSGSGGSGGSGSTSGTNTISIALATGQTNLGSEVVIRWSIIGLDGRKILSRNMSQKLPAGSVVERIAHSLATSIIGSEAAASYIAGAASTANTVTVTWISDAGFSITAEVITGNVAITVA